MGKRRGGGSAASRSTGKHTPGSRNKVAISKGTKVAGGSAQLHRAKQAPNRRPAAGAPPPTNAVNVHVHVSISVPKTLDARFTELARKAAPGQSRAQAPLIAHAPSHRPEALPKVGS